MNKPNIAMVVTCFNKENSIHDTIKSALEQSYDNKGLIVVDDCSTDESWNIIRSFFKKKDRYETNLVTGTTENGVMMCAIKNDTNKGLGFSKNAAIAATMKTSDAYIFIDGDDILSKEKVRRCVDKWMEDIEAIGIVYSDQIIDNQVEGFDVVGYVPPFSRRLLETTDYIENNYFITKKALVLAGKYEEGIITTDYDMQLRVSENLVFVHVPEILSTRRVTPYGQTVKVKDADRRKSYEATIKRAIQRRGAK